MPFIFQCFNQPSAQWDRADNRPVALKSDSLDRPMEFAASMAKFDTMESKIAELQPDDHRMTDS
jgi:hypothetical protein